MKIKTLDKEPSASLFCKRLTAYVELLKVRLTLLVLITMGVGFYLASLPDTNNALFGHVLLGTALVAGGAAVLNQWLERKWDSLMQRTKARPLPEGRIIPEEAFILGCVVSLVGFYYLFIWVNTLTSLLAGLTSIIYLLVYTPLKRKTILNTWVGAIPGAIPPMIGWVAVRNEVTIEAWALFSLLFFWQIPHFLAIAWLYREDYEAAGFKMLPVLDREGHHTARQMVCYTLVLIPISLTPYLLNMAGKTYFVFALGLGLAFLSLAICFWRYRTKQEAKYLFLASIFYLPFLLAVLALDKLPH